MEPAKPTVKTVFGKLFKSFQRLSHGSSIACRVRGHCGPEARSATALCFHSVQRAEEQPGSGSAVPVGSPSSWGRTGLRTIRSLVARRPYGKGEPVRQ
jgi:hypothetical protein